MENLDEQEMLIQYSEMAAFDFNSEEFKKIREDYIDCKNFLTKTMWRFNQLFNGFKSAKTW